MLNVYQLVARFPDPFFCGPDHQQNNPENFREQFSSTVFTTKEFALARADKFRTLIRNKFLLTSDYRVDIITKAFEVVE